MYPWAWQTSVEVYHLEGINRKLFIIGTTLALYTGPKSITRRSFHMSILYCFMEYCGCVQDPAEFGIKRDMSCWHPLPSCRTHMGEEAHAEAKLFPNGQNHSSPTRMREMGLVSWSSLQYPHCLPPEFQWTMDSCGTTIFYFRVTQRPQVDPTAGTRETAKSPGQPTRAAKNQLMGGPTRAWLVHVKATDLLTHEWASRQCHVQTLPDGALTCMPVAWSSEDESVHY